MKSRILGIACIALAYGQQDTVAQDGQYAQGLILDYYVIEAVEDGQEPTGRSMATLIDTAPPQFSYLAPFDIEPALNQFRDKFWGLNWTGFLRVEEAGPYSFNLMQNTSSDDQGDVDDSITCLSWLKLQDRVLVSHERQQLWDGNINAFGDIDLRPGIYEFQVWFACDTIGRVQSGTVGREQSVEESNPQITLNMRGPNDAMLRPIPKSQLLHEL